MIEEQKKKDEEIKAKCLYHEFLKLYDDKGRTSNLVNRLNKAVNKLIKKNDEDWNKLVTWNLPTEYERLRQDVIPNGVTPSYSEKQLSKSTRSTFNAALFYDYNQYCPQLVLLSQVK